MNTDSTVEPLESRIAPAAVFTFTDVDGDLVTITTSKGTNAELSSAVTTSMVTGAVTGGFAISAITLTGKPAFNGTDLSVTAKPGPLGGDGLVNVADIQAVGLDLGVVKVSGNLGSLDAGKGNVSSKIKSISAGSTSGANTWTLAGNVGSITIAHDLRGSEIQLSIPGTTLGLLKVGGSLVSESTAKSGSVSVTGGTIAKVIIGGNIEGGDNAGASFCGSISAKDILSVSVGGSLLGGDGPDSALISATGKIGPIIVKGALLGGDGARSGSIRSTGGIGSISIGGSLLGGAGVDSAQISAGTQIGAVFVKGSLLGTAAAQSAGIRSGGGIGTVAIGGSIIGGGGVESATIRSIGATGPVKIGHDMLSGAGGGSVLCNGGITALTVGGSVIATNPGASIATSTGDIGPVKIGGSMFGLDGGSGSVRSGARLVSLTVGGNVEATASVSPPRISSVGPMGPVKIGGYLSTNIYFGPSLKSLTVGGRVERAEIFSIEADAKIGAVQVGGNWIRSFLYTGIEVGMDGFFGTNDDTVAAGGNPAIFSKIASITIAGQIVGTAGGVDRYIFESQEIGAMKVNGVNVPLKPGRGNDTNATDTRFILGATRDGIVHEVP